MKPHITEFHVCGRVAESPQHVAFRQQLPSHHWLEAEAPLAGGDESRLDADRPASTLSPRSRPARNRSSPTGTWALPRWCSTRRMTWRKTMRTATGCVSLQRDATTVFPPAADNTKSGKLSQPGFRRLPLSPLRHPEWRTHKALQRLRHSTPAQCPQNKARRQLETTSQAPAIALRHCIQTSGCAGLLHSVNKTLHAAHIIRRLHRHFNHIGR